MRKARIILIALVFAAGAVSGAVLALPPPPPGDELGAVAWLYGVPSFVFAIVGLMALMWLVTRGWGHVSRPVKGATVVVGGRASTRPQPAAWVQAEKPRLTQGAADVAREQGRRRFTALPRRVPQSDPKREKVTGR